LVVKPARERPFGRDVRGPHHARENRIDALYLLRCHQRRGIGKALLTRLLAALNELGISEAHFDVVSINDMLPCSPAPTR